MNQQMREMAMEIGQKIGQDWVLAADTMDMGRGLYEMELEEYVDAMTGGERNDEMHTKEDIMCNELMDFLRSSDWDEDLQAEFIDEVIDGVVAEFEKLFIIMNYAKAEDMELVLDYERTLIIIQNEECSVAAANCDELMDAAYIEV